MTQGQYSVLYNSMIEIPDIVDAEESYFSDKHIMTNKELCGQVWGYVQEIHNTITPNVPATIDVVPLHKNGARFTLNYLNSSNEPTGMGYTGSVYSVARKNNIIKKIIDIFQAGIQILNNNTNDEKSLASEVGAL